MKKIFCLFMALHCHLAVAAQEVKLFINNQIDIYQFQPRLDMVLKRHAHKANWYWSASTLHRLENDKQEAERAEIVALLNNILREATDNQLKEAISLLTGQIMAWGLGEKVDIPLDFDLVRLKENFNPVVDFGEYQLSLRLRPTKVSYFGVSGAGDLPHSGSVDASHYVQAVNQSKKADPDYIYIIQPNGEVNKAAISYWSNEHNEVAPGSLIYFPLNETLFSDISTLNQRVAELARNRLQ